MSAVLISMAFAIAATLLAVGSVQFLVEKDFFLPSFLRAGRLAGAPFWAATWIIAVVASIIAILVLLARLDLHSLLSTASHNGSVGWGPISLWRQMGLVAKVVIVVLFIMSGWSVGVVIDRTYAFSAARKQSRAFAPTVAAALREGKIDEAIRVAEGNKNSHLARVVTAGLQELKAPGESADIPNERIEASKRALERAEAIVHAELKRGLPGLAAIGATAPFVGLFGTVVGILNAFRSISQNQATGLGAVASGVSEALVTTAIGLFVAIPAVMIFNYFSAKVKAYDVEIDNSSSQLIDYFVKRRGIRN